MNGYGIIKYADGDQYQGLYDDYRLNGLGSIKYANGDFY